MPKVPKYSASIDQKVVPSGPRRNVAQAGMIGRAVAGFGLTVSRVVQRREETLILDYITGLSGWQREFDTEYQSRKGSDAWGIADELKNKYEERFKGIDKLSLSSGAKDALKRKVAVYREHAMNKASVYVSVQDRVFKIQTFKNGRQGIIDDVQANFNNPTFIKERFTDLEKMANDAFYPELAEAQILAAKDEALEAAIERAMLTDPELAKEMLDEYRDDLLADTEERLEKAIKTALEKVDIQRKANELYTTLFEKYPNDPDAALKDLADPKYDREVAEKVKLMFRGIRADEARREAEEKQVEVETKERTNRDFVKKFSNNALTTDEVLTSPLDAHDQQVWISNIKKRADAIKAGNKNPFNITDPAVYGRWSQQINMVPESLKDTGEIWQAHGYGLSTDDTLKLAARWNTWKKGQEPGKSKEPKLGPALDTVYKRGHQTLGRFRTQELFGKKDDPETEKMFGEIALKWDQYFDAALVSKTPPSAEDAQKFFDEQLTPVKKKWFKDIWSILSQDRTYTSPIVEPENQEAIEWLKEQELPINPFNINEYIRQKKAKQ